MGTIQHDAIIATTGFENHFKKMKRRIKKLTTKEQELFKWGEGWINGYFTIVMIPDGSKEGWAPSNEGNDLREWFISNLVGYWEYATVSYGELGNVSSFGRTEDG